MRRRRFRRCELRYIMVLEGAFLLFVFTWPLIQIVAKSCATPSGLPRARRPGRSPVWDAEALMKVVSLTLLAVLLFNLAAIQVFALLHLTASGPAPDRDRTFVFSLIITCLYGGVIILARSRKRSWAREDRATPNSRKLTIAVYSYMVVVGVVAVLGLLASTIHAWPAGPAWLRVLRMAFGQVQFAVAGWFAAIYIDREGRASAWCGPWWRNRRSGSRWPASSAAASSPGRRVRSSGS